MVGNLQVDAAQKKLVSLLFTSICSVGRKTLMDKFTHIRIMTIPLQEKMQNCEEKKNEPSTNSGIY